MSEPKFTPGPWKIEARRDICDEFECWLHPINLHIHDRISDEDAHLIAAAPELYEALSHLEPYLDAIICYASTIEEHPQNGYILETKAALAKARGEG